MLKINVGFNRKVGEANYGSRGASVNLELELDSGLVGEPERLKDRIRQLFGLAKASVDEELHSQPGTNGHANGSNGNGNGPSHVRRRDNTRRATASQVRALNTIAERRQLHLASLLQERFGIREPAELTITEASSLIQDLNGATNGHCRGGKT
ncbi:MAG: hypothetical protein JNM18_19980 [Planctomycetaceae bacterium]|nr:hypothetical protein [Planctomycetaceae bacterium]